MPQPGKHWYHATFGTHNSWLPGDPRGFRSRNHKVHSSGDHRSPPPQGEHAGLHAHAKSISDRPIVLDHAAQATAGESIRQCCQRHGCRLLALAVSPVHTHLLVELPSDRSRAKEIVGYAKLSASMKLKDTFTGRLWAKGCGLKPIRDRDHHINTYQYILRHRDEGAWTWSYQDEEDGSSAV